MFQIILTSFGVSAMNGTGLESLDRAIGHARALGFEARIDQAGKPVAMYSPLRGVSYLETEDELERARR